jgi:hypothetical protein
MGRRDEEVREILGEVAWKAILREARKGAILPNKMDDFARMLDQEGKIYGDHARRGNAWDDNEVRDILADWFDEEMFQMERDTALHKLIDIFEDPSVTLRPLARALRHCLTTPPATARSR